MTKTICRFGLLGVLAAGLFVFSSQTAMAQHCGHYGGYSNFYGGHSYYGGFQRSGPIYHPPSVHYHKTYHADYLHWTPRRGWHTHGHYHITPHYVPGHYDYQHGNHIHLNPYYHRD